MATTTFHDYTGDGSDLTFNYSFPTFSQAEVVVEVGGVIVDNYTIPSYATSGTKTVTFDNSTGTVNTNVCESSGAPKNTLLVRIRRSTNVDSRKADYTAGSSLKAADLTNNNDQLLRSAQENTLKTDTITTLMVKNAQITRDKIAADAINGTKIADDSVDSEHIVADSIDTEHYAPSSVDTTAIADNAVTLAKIAGGALPTDITVASANIVDGTIVNADISSSAGIAGSKLADDGVTYAKIQNVSATNRILGRDSASAGIIEEITPANLRTMINVEDGATADQTASEVKSLIASSPLDSSHLATNSVTVNELADNAVDRAAIVADAVDGTKLADDAVTTEHYTDNSIQRVHLQADIVDGTKIADDSVDSEHLVADSIDTEHYAPGSIDPTALATNSVETAKIENAKLTTLAGMQAGTASILASSTALTSTTAELNLLDGKSIVTSVSSSSTNDQIPTAAAVNTQIANLLDQTGGFVPIATEAAFPNAHPDASNDTGTIVSIADAGGLVVNGSGVATNAATVGGTAVTINGIDSSLYSTTIAAGKGMLVQTTAQSDSAYASGPVYTYHRLIVDEAGVATAQSLVSSFNERYRTGTKPADNDASNDDGDLFFDTNANKMYVYDGANNAGGSFKEVTSAGDFKLLTVVPDGATSGSPTFNGSIVSYDLRDSTNAASVTSVGQLLVILNGVLQKPNAGSYSASEEGFYLEGSNGIKFCTAPASGSSLYVTQIGSTVTLNEPADNTISSAKIQNGAVITAKIADDAVDADKLASNAVVTASIVDDAVTADKIANSVNSAIAANTAKTSNATHTGEVTGGTALTIADNVVDEANLKVSNSPSNGYFLSAQSGNTGGLTWAQVTTDLVGDTSPQLGGDLASNGNDIDFADNDRATFGTGADCVFTHSGADFAITNSVGNLNLLCNSTDAIQLRHGSEHMVRAVTDGTVELYFDGTKKFETQSAGAQLFGNLTVGTDGGAIFLSNPDGFSPKLQENAGSLEFYTNNNLRMSLGNGGNLLFQDNRKAEFGANSDLQIYHDGTDSRIHNGTGSLVFRTPTNYIFYNSDASEKHAQFLQNGAVELYHNNSKRLETTSSGVNFGGNLSSDSGANFTINGGGASGSAGSVLLRCASENAVVCNANGSVDLYHNNSKKLSTVSDGIEVHGSTDSARIEFGDAYSNSRIGYFGLNRFGIDAHRGIQIRDSNDSYAVRFTIDANGHAQPGANNTYDLGTSSYRWRNVYTNDLNLSNEGSSNDVDGTWGDWTIQEGESDLFLKNNRSGKKYKFNLTEVS
nr:hypothetical protein [uncultured Mediterranean phage uvMED]